MTDISKRLGEEKIIAIFRGIPEDKITECTRAVYRGGIRIFEITFNPKDPDAICKTASAFERLYSEFGENVTLGAVAVAAGATILTQRAVAEGDYDEIERNARAHADSVK